MKPIKFLSILLLITLITSVINIHSSSAQEVNFNPVWGVSEGEQLVYKVTDVLFNTTSSIPVTTYDESSKQDREIGSINKGDVFMVRVSNLPDFQNDESQVDLDLRSSHTTEQWWYNYSANIPPMWPESFDGPAFFYPVVAVPEDPTNWTAIESEWTNGGFTATYSGNSFTISGTNSTLNITSFSIEWDTDTGGMLSYSVEGIDGDSGLTYKLALDFLYFRDESQWNLQWGVTEGNMIMYQWTVNEVTGEEGVEFGGDENHRNYAYDEDLMLFQIDNLSPLMNLDGPMYWNGTVKTENWESEFDFEYKNIGEDDGPITWYPILPLGDDDFYANITDDFEAFGATVTKSSSTLEVQISEFQFLEHTTWDLNTGVMKSLEYKDSRDVNSTIDIVLNFKYLFDPQGEPVFSTDSTTGRYVVDQAKNDTNNFLDFGEVGDYSDGTKKRFKLYSNDVFRVSTYFKDDPNNEQWMWSGRTSSGFDIESEMQFAEPGFDIYADGPPMLLFIIPIGTEGITGDTWWTTLSDIYLGLDFSSSLSGDEFSLEGQFEGIHLTASWEKTTGILQYYKVDAVMDGTQLVWEMHLSDYDIKGSAGISWGVTVGDSYAYQVKSITSNISFGESETPIQVGDVIETTVKNLSDIGTEQPYFEVDMQLNDIIESSTIFVLDPGFEFVEFDNQQGNGPWFMYFFIPVGTMDYFNTVEGMYEDAGYNVQLNATHITIVVSNPSIAGEILTVNLAATWNLATGVLEHYLVSGNIDGEQTTVEIVLIISDMSSTPSVSSTSQNNSTTSKDTQSNPLNFQFNWFFGVSMLVIIRFVDTRKKKYQ